MATTSKNKVLLLVVFILLLTNVSMLVFLLYNKGDHRNPNSDREAQMVEFLQKEVGFNATQMQQYDTLSKRHRERVKADFDEVRSTKSDLYKELGNQAFSDSAIDYVAGQSAAMQKGLETKMLLHFATIRSLCTPEQLPKFDSLFYKVWQHHGGDSHKKPGN